MKNYVQAVPLFVLAICVICGFPLHGIASSDRYELKFRTAPPRVSQYERGSPILFKLVIGDRSKQLHFNAVQLAKANERDPPPYTNGVHRSATDEHWVTNVNFTVLEIGGPASDRLAELANSVRLIEHSAGFGTSHTELRVHALFGLDPSITEDIPAGKYSFMCTYLSDTLELQSTPLELRIVDREEGAIDDLESRYAAARYSMLTGNGDAAVSNLQDIVSKKLDGKRAEAKLATALERSGDIEAALVAYKSYVDTYPPSNHREEETIRYLKMRIIHIQRQLDSQGE